MVSMLIRKKYYCIWYVSYRHLIRRGVFKVYRAGLRPYGRLLSLYIGKPLVFMGLFSAIAAAML